MEFGAPGQKVARFGLYEADVRQRVLTKGGLKVRLQDQPFQVLALLLERPGELVTREEIQQKLWPADTYVAFDDGLNTAIKKLRSALSDTADNPRFIETVPRRGYRFVAPVNILPEPQLATGNQRQTEPLSSFQVPETSAVDATLVAAEASQTWACAIRLARLRRASTSGSHCGVFASAGPLVPRHAVRHHRPCRFCKHYRRIPTCIPLASSCLRLRQAIVPSWGRHITALTAQILHEPAPRLGGGRILCLRNWGGSFRLLEKEPSARYQSSRELQVDLTNLLRDLELGADSRLRWSASEPSRCYRSSC